MFAMLTNAPSGKEFRCTVMIIKAFFFLGRCKTTILKTHAIMAIYASKLTGDWNTLAGQHLLGLVEAVDLVYEHDGSPLAQPQFVLRLLDHLSHVTGRRAGGWELHKAHRSLLLALAGYDVSESGLGKRERGEKSKTRYELMIVTAAITSFDFASRCAAILVMFT